MSVPTEISDYAAAADYLLNLKVQGPKLGLERMQIFSAALGHPELAVPTIHVAGTNGKGSVSAMLEAIFRAAGWRTGLYTSPHLVKLGERVQVNREMLQEEEIVAFTRELRPVAEALAARDPHDRPTFFEFMTAMAFLQFARKACDIAIIEVGLGGRLDATNVVLPEVTAITSIAMDHCEFLGHEIALIAREKAGIIKPGRPVVMGRVPPDAEHEIRAVAAQQSAQIISVSKIFGDDSANYPETNLEGDYQRWNAATASLVAGQFPARWKLSSSVIAAGLRTVNWPGRWQRVSVGGKKLVLDASHNPEGAMVLESNLQSLLRETNRPPVIVTGVLGAGRAKPLLEVIARYAREIFLVVPQQSRACSHAELRSLLPPGFAGPIIDSSVLELFPHAQACIAGTADDIVVVTGSIYLLGEVMSRLEPQRGTGEGWLQDF